MLIQPTHHRTTQKINRAYIWRLSKGNSATGDAAYFVFYRKSILEEKSPLLGKKLNENSKDVGEYQTRHSRQGKDEKVAQ